VALHLEHAPDLHEVDILAIALADDLVKRAEDVEGVLQNLALVRAPADVGHYACEQVEGVDVLEDVRRLVCDENYIEVFQRLVHEANVRGFDGGVLRAGRNELRE
jgi:hypothetical protein